MKGIYIFLANGFEDTEAVTTIDILRRAEIAVKTVSILEDKFVVASHGIPVVADMTWGEFKENVVGPLSKTGSTVQTGRDDFMIFPGGKGTHALADSKELMDLMKEHYAQGGSIAAICAAPGLVVSQLDDLKDVRFTCFDGYQDAVIAKGGIFTGESAVTCGRIITGRGAGHAVNFALEIVAYLAPDRLEKVKHGLML